MLQNNLETKVLPSWVDDFNGIFGLFDGISSIFDKIFGTNIGDENIELEEILKNQELLNELRDKLSGISGDLETIIKNGELNTELLQKLISISNGHGDMLNNIQSQIDSLRTFIAGYLAEISGMLRKITQQNTFISTQLMYITQQLLVISQKLDTLNVNVLISTTITEITPSYQRMKYANKKFNELSTAHTEKYLRTIKDNSNIVQIDTNDLQKMNELIELAKNITANSHDNFEFYLETFQDVMVGETLFERSALHTISELIRSDQTPKEYGSEVAKAYTYLINLISVQAQSYATLAACRKVLGLSDIDYKPILLQYIKKQLNIFKSEELPKLSNEFTAFNYIGIEGENTPRHCVVKADPGYAVVGLEIIKSDNDLNLIAYQAKLKQNYELDKETISKITVHKINEVFGQIEDTFAIGIFCAKLEFPQGYVITQLDFSNDKGYFVTYELTANRYNPSTGDLDLSDSITKNSSTEENNKETIIELEPETKMFFPSKISDTFLTPMYSFNIDIVPHSTYYRVTCENYLPQYLEASDLSNKETSLLYIVDNTI
ncbi:vegetative insecticidal protein Vip3A family protein [Bacillus cereus]|uniref:vegetative insecticidal protein Vip3A family protein n=1 Tax=Bacillus TaxID=1386 RepID=UPI0009AAF068|nr:vegetative insecticidal protein Vip3A family protein [Bacillus cereus]PFT75965.1 hypothetical protein COK74_25605 [Bacillus cereus]